MTSKTRKWRMLLAFGQRRALLASTIWMALAASGAQAHGDGLRYSTTLVAHCCALAPVEPPVMPHTEREGTYGLRMRVRYFDAATGNVELRRHQYSFDDNLKMQQPRTSITWSVRFRF